MANVNGIAVGNDGKIARSVEGERLEKVVADVLHAFADKANLMGAAVVALVGGVFGAHWQIFGFFLLLEAVDFYYGRRKAIKTGTLSSAKGAEGVQKKIGYWVVIVLAFLCAELLVDFGAQLGMELSFLRLLGWFTLGVYILNELTSIVENLVVLGVEVPQVFVRGLKAAKSALDDAGNRVLPAQEEKDDGD